MTSISRRLRVMLYGSSPMAAEWIKRTMEAFDGADIMQGYGLTETSPILTTLDPAEHRQAIESGDLEILRSAGRPVVGVDMKILGPDGREVSPDDTGEVVVRGPNVSSGYLNRPEETSAAFKDGWFHTVDVGRLDVDGYLFVQDRKKDMVITGGRKCLYHGGGGCPLSTRGGPRNRGDRRTRREVRRGIVRRHRSGAGFVAQRRIRHRALQGPHREL